MTTTVYNAQFLTLDFRLLDDPGFCHFMRSPAFAVYLQLRRYVWRGRDRRHPVARVNELYREGKLVASVPRQTLAGKLFIAELSHISRHLSVLESLEVIKKHPTGRQNAYELGTWEDRSRARDGSCLVELFYLEQQYGADRLGQLRPGELPPGLTGSDVSQTPPSDVSQTTRRNSDVSQTPHSDMSQTTRQNKETNKKKKERELTRARGSARAREAPQEIRFRSPFEPIDDKERPDDVLVFED